MNELKIYPDPVLRDKARRVENLCTERIEYIIKIMEKIIIEHKAVGLAAPQIGVLEQIIVVDSGNGYIKLINPEIIDHKGEEAMEEGCLSFPEVEIEIRRPNFVIVKGINEHGKKKTIEANDLVARAILHEIDHLNGVLIIDSLSPIERIKFDMNWRRGEYEKRHPSRIL